jgi:pullulanase/glycogen debranching enzyme
VDIEEDRGSCAVLQENLLNLSQAMEGAALDTEAQEIDLSASFGPEALDPESYGLQNQDQNLFGDIEVSYEESQDPGSVYNPETQKISFMVEAGSKQVWGMKLVLFEDEDATHRHRTIDMKYTGDGMYHVTLKGSELKPGLKYAFIPDSQDRNEGKVSWVIDPHAKAAVRTTPTWLASKISNKLFASRIFGKEIEGHFDNDRVEALLAETDFDDNWKNVVRGLLKTNPTPGKDHFLPPRSVVTHLEKDHDAVPLKAYEPAERVFYEMHVRDTWNFPEHLLEGYEEFKEKRGTIEFLECEAFIEYLKKLGVTTLELMPIQIAEDEWPIFSSGRQNVWKYSSLSVMAPEPDYFFTKDPLEQLKVLRRVKNTLHKHGIELIIDFVGGHTHECGKELKGNPIDQNTGYTKGPISSLRGLDEQGYYHQKGDATGCSNTIRTDTPIAQKLLLNARDHWLETLGLDGLRVDQATVFGRDENLQFQSDHEFLIKFADTSKLIVGEANDALGFHVAEFPEMWQVWTFRHRDRGREFFKNGGNARRIVHRLAGQSDMFDGVANRAVHHAGVHDGPRLIDDTELAETARAALAMTIFSPGPFLICRGDEVLRSQNGNGNAYDKEEFLGLDWDPHSSDEGSGGVSGAEKKMTLEFVRSAIRLRKELKVFETQDPFPRQHLRWYRADGERVEKEAQRTKHDDGARNHAFEKAWDEQNDFLGAFYVRRDLRQNGRPPSPIYVALAGKPDIEIKLPFANAERGWRWHLVSESATGKVADQASPLYSKPGGPAVAVSPEDLYTSSDTYTFEKAGHAVFQLIRVNTHRKSST